MKYARLIGAVCACVLALIATKANSASVTFYSDRSAFVLSLGNIIADDYTNPGYLAGDLGDRETHDFHSDAHMSNVLGETSYTATTWPNSNVVFSGGAEIGRPNLYCSGCNGTFLLDFTSTSIGDHTGVDAVGMTMSSNYQLDSYVFPFPEGTEGYVAYTSFANGSTANFLLPLATWGPGTTPLIGPSFWGIISDEKISSIHVGLAGGETTMKQGFELDELIIGSTTPLSPVPLPAALPLFGTGLAIMGFIGWRRKSWRASPCA